MTAVEHLGSASPMMASRLWSRWPMTRGLSSRRSATPTCSSRLRSYDRVNRRVSDAGGDMVHTLYEIERRDADGRWICLETTMDNQTAAARCEALALADNQPHLYRVV